MIKPELYKKTVDILVQAYFDDTLVSGNQCGCAVGNIVAANMGIKLIKHDIDEILPEGIASYSVLLNTETEINNGLWYNAISCGRVNEEDLTDVIRIQVASTGYSFQEIAKIEISFECCDTENSEDEMFERLMAVIDCLDQIHENTDEQVTKMSKERFIREQKVFT